MKFSFFFSFYSFGFFFCGFQCIIVVRDFHEGLGFLRALIFRELFLGKSGRIVFSLWLFVAYLELSREEG